MITVIALEKSPNLIYYVFQSTTQSLYTNPSIAIIFFYIVIILNLASLKLKIPAKNTIYLVYLQTLGFMSNQLNNIS